jgi:hypothetical protein
MSYAPIYSKLHELEQRLAVVEASSKAVSSVSATQPTAATTDFDISGIRKEIDDLSKVVSGFAFATKEELPDVSGFATLASLDAFATKEELTDVSGFATIASLDAFATKEELPDVSGFATKEELVAYAELSAKFDNLLNVVSHLNTKITEANEKIVELEARP